jgi:glucose-6-phosphate dehydrogenase assembly protein OpcA
MSDTAMQPPRSHPPRQVPLEELEGELVKLWRHPEQAAEIQSHAIRACMSNLIIHCVSQDAPQKIDNTLIEIVRLHPCRVLLLLEDHGRALPQLEAFVSAHVDSAQQVFSEQVTLKTGPAGLERVPSIVRPLILGDLPTSLWWSSGISMPVDQGWFRELTEMVDQMIYDSFAWRNPRQGIVAVTDWLASPESERSAADLAWRRLKPWRRLIAQALEPAAVPGALRAINEVTIEHGPHALPQAWLLAGWMAQRLGWNPRMGKVLPGAQVSWSFEGVAGPIKVTCRRLDQQEYELMSVTVAWRQGNKSAKAKFARLDDRRLSTSYEGVDQPSRVMAVPQRSPGEIIARQLPDFGREPMFDKTLAIARGMALAVEE